MLSGATRAVAGEWCLMQPPTIRTTGGGVQWDARQWDARNMIRSYPDAPLKFWLRWKSFDDAGACERERQELQRQADEVEKSSMVQPDMAIVEIAKSYSHAQCVATDDPALAR